MKKFSALRGAPLAGAVFMILLPLQTATAAIDNFISSEVGIAASKNAGNASTDYRTVRTAVDDLAEEWVDAAAELSCLPVTGKFRSRRLRHHFWMW